MGRSVVVTRARHQAKALTEPLEALGAEVVGVPVIAIVEPPDLGPARDAIEVLTDYDWVVLTSTNAVDRFFALLAESGVVGLPDGVNVAVVGSATAERLAVHGLAPDVVPTDFRAEGLVDEFTAMGAGEGWRVLVPRALEAREILPDTLRELGVHVDVVPVYRTVAAAPPADVIERLARGVDAVIFTSPSTFRHFRAALESAGVDAIVFLRGTAIASIGPVTSDVVRGAGLEVAVEPAESTVPALVAALGEYF